MYRYGLFKLEMIKE